jgi:hypothetical protein
MIARADYKVEVAKTDGLCKPVATTPPHGIRA